MATFTQDYGHIREHLCQFPDNIVLDIRLPIVVGEFDAIVIFEIRIL